MILRSFMNAIVMIVLVAASGPAHHGHPEASPGSQSVVVRVAYTMTVFRDVHMSDAKASLKVWADAAARELDVHAHTQIDFVPDLEELARRFKFEGVDLGGSTMPEFCRLEQMFDLDPVLAVSQAGACTIKYYLLVRRSSDMATLSDLAGTNLVLFDNPRTSLGLPWLDLLLDEEGLGNVTTHFRDVTLETKLAKVVLPIFFGQADACLVTHTGFELMSELNPQVERELQVLAESPEVIPMVTFLRRDYKPSFREDLIESMCNLHTTPAGQQILNLMQGDGVVVAPSSALERSRELLRRWNRLAAVASVQGKSFSREESPAGGGVQ